jgi:hypothetical protein
MNLRQSLWTGTLCILLATAAGAQEQALNLTLLKTSVRTQNDSFQLTKNGTQAFVPT